MRYVIGVAVLLALSIVPNLIWLATSTVKIRNTSDQSVSEVGYLACETIHSIGTLRPGESRFRFLEACGDDTLEILIGDSKFCQTYVEGELYHVDAKITDVDNVSCGYDDFLSSLFIKEFFW